MTDIPAGYSSGFQTSAWSVDALVDLITAVGASNEFDGATITGSTVDSSVIGGATPAAAHFTTLAASSTTALSGATTVSGTLSATNSVTLSPASHNVVLSPSGTGVVTIAPATAGTLDNVAIGGSTPLAAHVTTLNATGATVLSNASIIMAGLPTSDPHVAGQLWTNTHVLTVSAG